MYAPYIDNKDFQIKSYISSAIKTKSNANKKHSDSLNCLMNCAEFRVTLYITQKPANGKNSIFYVQKGDDFSPLFFYDIPSNKVIEEIQSKNEAKKLLNDNQKIKTENEIIDKYEQIKKNKMLLFNYIQFPLININKENNENKLSTIIIFDNRENDFISNFSTNSSVMNQQTCSFSLEIRNTNNCDYLFSLSDINDCKEIKIKLNGTVHEQALFDKEIVFYISPELIENSIRQRMEIYSNNDNVENLIGKYFFTKLNDSNANNIGILFSLKKKRENSKLKYDKDYLKTDRYLINKIFLVLDMWITPDNNSAHNTIDSTKSSSHLIIINKAEEKEKNNNKYSYNYNPNEYAYNYPYYYNNYTEPKPNYTYYNDYTNYNNRIDSNQNIIYNDLNKIYLNNRNNLYDENYQNMSQDYIPNNNSNYNDFNYSFNDFFFKADYDNFDYYYDKDSELNNLFNLIRKIEKINTYREPEIFLDTNDIKSDILYCQEKLNRININLGNEFENKSNNNLTIDESQFNDKIFINRTLFINMNEELMRKLFEKYEQDKCISNYTIVKNMLDINMNFNPKVQNRLINSKLTDFFDVFQNANQLYLNIPYVTKKGKLYINCFSPSLSSMILVLKANKKVQKEIKRNVKKFRGFTAETHEKNKKILKIEFEEIKPIYQRELLYNKISKIKRIIGETKLRNKNVLIKNSYFSILWSVANNLDIKSSFLAYYTFDFKLIGILILNLNYNHWMTPFSYKLVNYHDYKIEYEKNVENVKKMFKDLPIDKEDDHCDKYFKYDYYNYLRSNKTNNY